MPSQRPFTITVWNAWATLEHMVPAYLRSSVFGVTLRIELLRVRSFQCHSTPCADGGVPTLFVRDPPLRNNKNVTKQSKQDPHWIAVGL